MNIVCSFSGGRTSAFMAGWLKNHYKDGEVRFVFANTGAEHPKTLEFVDKVDRYFGLDLAWIEADIQHEANVGTKHRMVDFETASRNCEPFEEMIKKYGIPNTQFIHCTRELKIQPITDWERQNGISKKDGWHRAIGIRIDEIDRISVNAKRDALVYPLVSMVKANKGMILDFWRKMPFDLDLPEHYGNCVFCYKKTDRKLLTVMQEEPHWFDFCERMEKEHPRSKQHPEYEEQMVFFRGKRSVQDMRELLESYGDRFVSFEEAKRLDQIDMFGGNELDALGGCSESCEAFT